MNRRTTVSDDPIPYQPTDRAALLTKQLRIDELEHILRHFDRSSLHLAHYCRAVLGTPDPDEWQLIRDMIDEMVDPYGPRNPHR